ncbi:MAG TPA: zinc ribbon domain-containing protein [Rudaea sp.]|jgi:putative FmdB family regulatory protein
MPIYEFECLACSERFDRLQKLSDPDPDSCPNCGATGVRRRLTAPSFRLAGSGWYETDFKKDGDKKRNLVDKPEGAKVEPKPETTAKAEPVVPAKSDRTENAPRVEKAPAAVPSKAAHKEAAKSEK